MAENRAVRDVYEQGAGKAKVYGAIAKLTLEINGDSTELERVYAEIGRLCYEQHREAPEGFFAPLFAQVESLESRIAEKQAAVSALRGGDAEADIEVDIVEEDSLFEQAAVECYAGLRCEQFVFYNQFVIVVVYLRYFVHVMSPCFHVKSYLQSFHMKNILKIV
jgi:hypothetical protein